MGIDESNAIFELVDEKVQKSGTKVYIKFLLLFSFIILVVILVGALLMGIITPRLKIKEFNQLYTQSKQTVKNDPDFFDSNYYQLKKEESFLKSKLAKSDLDSISLSINIPDSNLSLEIKGIAIYNVKIDYINVSPLFKSLDKKALMNCFSLPFTINYQFATIVKEPIVIKQAPKDTTEYANQPAPSIDTLKPRMVAYYFQLDKNIILDIRQSEKTDLAAYLKYSMNYYYWYTGKQLQDIIHFHLPEYIPWIQIQINCKDALALYRALPNKAVISIRL
jgi:hypothetical protein